MAFYGLSIGVGVGVGAGVRTGSSAPGPTGVQYFGLAVGVAVGIGAAWRIGTVTPPVVVPDGTPIPETFDVRGVLSPRLGDQIVVPPTIRLGRTPFKRNS